MQTFILHSSYQPQGDQPQAIEEMTKNIKQGVRDQILLGVTGSGKTFTMANVIARTGRPTLIMAPNKTLAAQLFNEFKEIFPENAVEYFVSYYDYYQPEAYLPHSDVYIEKDASINEEIDKLRHSATHALLTKMVLYFFEYKDAFELLVFGSYGTRYNNFLNGIIFHSYNFIFTDFILGIYFFIY